MKGHFSMKKYRWTALLLALVLAAGVCAGCGKKQTDAPAQDKTPG